MSDKWKLPELELKILNHIWIKGDSATVQEVLDSWEGEKPLYTTILKKLQVMEKKGVVSHEKKGKAYVYIPLVSRDEVSSYRLGKMVRNLFGGNKLDLVSAFLKNTDLEKEDLKAIKEMIRNKEKEMKK